MLVIEPRDLTFTLYRRPVLTGDGYAEVGDGRLDALDVDLRHTVDAQGPQLGLTWPGGGAELRPWFPPA